MSHGTTAKIIVLEHDEDMARQMSLHLDELGYSCVTASTVAMGLSQFAEGDVDMVIIDVLGLGAAGTTAVERIRERSDVPIIILVGLAQEQAKRDEFADTTNVWFLRKPFDAERMEELVESVMSVSEG